ncbi:unnamed protein product [Fraxinus pennsylvanica]|uniref:Serine-rich protein-like protein n=1 Tax=Fraxinus pennsylvanica TaxID=56036 RepID=A0AAD1ZN78_9LAMI|nr:unnamed protein product [Fraxinus pennsylvanica]
MSTSSRKSRGPVLPIASTLRRSISPSGRFCNSAMAMSMSELSSSFTCSSNSPSGFFQNQRSSSPTRVNLHALPSSSPTPSVRFSINRSGSPRRSMAVSPQNPVVRKHNGNGISLQKRTCLCSPTTHPGSFRCALHKNNFGGGGGNNNSISYSPYRLNARRSAMTNSLVRIGTVEAASKPFVYHVQSRGSLRSRVLLVTALRVPSLYSSRVKLAGTSSLLWIEDKAVF